MAAFGGVIRTDGPLGGVFGAVSGVGEVSPTEAGGVSSFGAGVPGWADCARPGAITKHEHTRVSSVFMGATYDVHRGRQAG